MLFVHVSAVFLALAGRGNLLLSNFDKGKSIRRSLEEGTDDVMSSQNGSFAP